MPAPFDPLRLPNRRTDLLLEAVELLVDELALLATEQWDRLPELKKKKVVTASRLRRLRAESGAADGVPSGSIESLIADLEGQSRNGIRARLELIDRQILALQELSLYWRECLSVSLDRAAQRPLGSGGTVV